MTTSPMYPTSGFWGNGEPKTFPWYANAPHQWITGRNRRQELFSDASDPSFFSVIEMRSIVNSILFLLATSGWASAAVYKSHSIALQELNGFAASASFGRCGSAAETY